MHREYAEVSLRSKYIGELVHDVVSEAREATRRATETVGKAINWIRWLTATVLSRKRSATGSIGSRKNRSSKLPTMLLDQEVQQRSKDKIVNYCSNSCNSHQLNLATTSKRGLQSFSFTTSRRSTVLNTTKTTRTSC